MKFLNFIHTVWKEEGIRHNKKVIYIHIRLLAMTDGRLLSLCLPSSLKL